MNQIAVRPATFEDRFAMARLIIDTTYRAFYGRVPDKCLDWLAVEESALNWGENFEDGALPAAKHLFVAGVAGVDVTGLALARSEAAGSLEKKSVTQAYPCELASLQVDPAWQRRGVGRKLLAEVARALALKGCSKLLVRVLADNPNVVFYEKLGAERVGAQPYDWEGYATEELSFAWEDIAVPADVA